MLQFNSKGLLIPNTNIKSNITELEKEFVTSLDPHRTELFQKYIHYSDSLKSELSDIPLLQWIDGSFVTKKQVPEDVDLVTFIAAESVEAIGTRIDDFKYPLSIEKYGVDAYIVKVYERKHKQYPLYIGDQMYWMDNFDKTRRNRNGIKLPKGFLEINY